jgi:uncharacterized protein YkwD
MSENRRILSVVVLLSVFLGVPASGAFANSGSSAQPSTSLLLPAPDAAAVVRAMNIVRMAHGVRPLVVGPKLRRAARAHSVDMARRGYFDHGAFVQRLRRFGVRARIIGENLAEGNDMVAMEVVQMWMASPPHRANLLDRAFRHVGVGMAGANVVLVTADFSS